MTGAEGLAAAFVGGVLTSASPCVLAMGLLVAGAMPSAATALMRRFTAAQAWLPGRRSFALLLAGAGGWWAARGLGYAA